MPRRDWSRREKAAAAKAADEAAKKAAKGDKKKEEVGLARPRSGGLGDVLGVYRYYKV